MEKKGFTLFEMLAVLLVIIVFFFISIPIVIKLIENSKLNSFKISSISVIDSIDYYIANNKFAQIPIDGLDIKKLDETVLKNNNFNSGKIILNKKGNIELVYLKEGNNCAIGTKENIRVSDNGCGKLDKTKPSKVDLFLKNSHSDYIEVIAAAIEKESKIIKYEISIDDGKFRSNKNQKYNVFKIDLDDSKYHKFKIRVTNEAGLKSISKEKKFKLSNQTITVFKGKNNKSNVQNEKQLEGYIDNNYTYEFSKDLTNWYKYNSKINFNNNEIIYTRIKNNNKIVSYNTINISNIDNLLNGSYPKLKENMIPVIYKDNNWVIANKNISYWDYENKIWANSVFVREKADINDKNSKNRNYYLSNEAIGEVVYDKDIIASFVWIPRYRYKLWNINGTDINEINKGTKSIEIEFESNKNQKSTGLKNEKISNDEWLTHKAFSYDKEVNGFWISKYEASVDINSLCYNNSNIENCNNLNHDLFFIKSDNYLRNISISNSYFLSKKYKGHLITNLEWGSLAYLSSSKYGQSNNPLESSTGNITGVYLTKDNYEMVMANYNKDSGNNIKDNSGFKPYGKNEWPNIYIDYYYTITTKGKILGDATLETEKWYNSENEFITGEKPFIKRGNNSLFSFNSYSGAPNSNVTFRIVLD